MFNSQGQVLKMVASSNVEVQWPSGDCYPVLATKLTPEELVSRFETTTFRARDDLDWFTGLLLQQTRIGPILVMRHDNNPEKLTAFYVDRNLDIDSARREITQLFLLGDAEIAWTP